MKITIKRDVWSPHIPPGYALGSDTIIKKKFCLKKLEIVDFMSVLDSFAVSNTKHTI